MQGTKTDAVLLRSASTTEDSILAWYKTATSSDITFGIGTAILKLLRQAPVKPKDIICVTIGTTLHITFVPSHIRGRDSNDFGSLWARIVDETKLKRLEVKPLGVTNKDKLGGGSI